MPAIYTIPGDAIPSVLIDGQKHGHARLIATFKEPKDAPTIADGILSDCQHVDAKATNIRGYAVRLTKTEGPRYDLIQKPRIKLEANLGFGGVYVEWRCPDHIIDGALLSYFRDCGIWLEGGAGTVANSYVDGCDVAIRTGGNKDSGPANLLSASRFNDSRICMELLASTTVSACHSQDGFQRNIFADAQVDIASTSVYVRPANKDGDGTWMNPIGIEFTPKANWSSDSGMMVVEKGSTGILLAANNCTIHRKITTHGASTALHIPNQVYGNDITLDLCGVGAPALVRIDDLGAANTIRLNGPNVILKAPSALRLNNTITINGKAA